MMKKILDSLAMFGNVVESKCIDLVHTAKDAEFYLVLCKLSLHGLSQS